MIKATQKPLAEIMENIGNHKKILVAGCGTCTSICFSGGERETGLLASEIKMALGMAGKQADVDTTTIQRQCEIEFIEESKDKIKDRDAIVSLACGVGAQVIAQQYPDIDVLPGLNTLFMGPPKELGFWYENCQGCGDCILHLTGGICPIARCAKSLLNGPCGGCEEGKCETSKDIDCAWSLIVEKLGKKGKLELLDRLWEAKDWSKSRDGGQRVIIREDLIIKKEK